MLLSAIEDFDYDGAPVRALRARGLFERKKALVATIDDEEVSTDQIFHMCLFAGSQLAAAHVAMLALFLGGAPHDIDQEELSKAMEGDAEVRARLFRAGVTLVPPKGEAFDLACFVRALSHAAVIGVGTFIDA